MDHPDAKHLFYLDGLRGIASFWVVVSHVMMLTGWMVPVMSWGTLAVDLFMILSGFLMTYQALTREADEPLDSLGTWVRFLLRRFFRLAPVYYLLLFIALLLGPRLAIVSNLRALRPAAG